MELARIASLDVFDHPSKIRVMLVSSSSCFNELCKFLEDIFAQRFLFGTIYPGRSLFCNIKRNVATEEKFGYHFVSFCSTVVFTTNSSKFLFFTNGTVSLLSCLHLFACSNFWSSSSLLVLMLSTSTVFLLVLAPLFLHLFKWVLTPPNFFANLLLTLFANDSTLITGF